MAEDPSGEKPVSEAAEPLAGVEDGAPAPRDAAFEDVYRPTRLKAEDAEDLRVVSALLQDAAATVGDMAYLPQRRRFALVVSRFRWEERAAQERVRAGLHFDGVLSAKTRGFDPREKEKALSILAITFEPGETPPAGRARIAFSGEAEILLELDAVDVAMADMGRPWPAARPAHPGAE